MTINAITEHGNHIELEKNFFDDGAIGYHCALQWNENVWSKRLVESLNNCSYNFLRGWEFEFYGTKTDPNDFDELQQYITGISMHNAVNGYVYHGIPDIFDVLQQ